MAPLDGIGRAPGSDLRRVPMRVLRGRVVRDVLLAQRKNDLYSDTHHQVEQGAADHLHLSEGEIMKNHKECLCGCGEWTLSNWVAGHDKRATDAVLAFITGQPNITWLARENPALLRVAMEAGRVDA